MFSMKWSNILLPIVVYILGTNILSKRPTGYNEVEIIGEESLKRYKNIILPGFMEYTETYKLYNLSDVLCVPSIPLYTKRLKWEEQFGYVFTEAMACGKPVVSTISGSIPEVVEDGGILVKPNDIKELTNTLESLYKDENLRNKIGKKAFNIAKQRYDSKIMSKKLAKLYYNLIK